MKTYTRVSYDILSKIFKEKTYSTQALFNALEKEEKPELIYKIVLGVLDSNIELEYIVDFLSKKPPQNAVAIILKIGIYCIKYMDSLPDYAVINNCVELSKEIGKQAVSGFVNAVLKAAARGEYPYPEESDKVKYLSIKYSKPEWLVDKLIRDYGEDTAINIISVKPYEKTHIRPNLNTWSMAELVEYLKKYKIDFIPSQIGGVLLNVCAEVKKLFKKGLITYQSVTSMCAVKALGVSDRTNVLDLCSAPGGKSVLIAEQNPHGTVTACDIYPHRIELVAGYAKRMVAKNIETKVMDATIFEPKFVERFESVLVDAPCSSLGVIRKEPDILLNRKPEDIFELQALQQKILNNASRYVKRGGTLVYSTCTITKEENGEVIEDFLKNHSELSLAKIKMDMPNDGTIQFFPAGAVDGFYIAKMVKK